MAICAACHQQEATIYNEYLEAEVCQTCHEAILRVCAQLQWLMQHYWLQQYDLHATHSPSTPYQVTAPVKISAYSRDASPYSINLN